MTLRNLRIGRENWLTFTFKDLNHHALFGGGYVAIREKPTCSEPRTDHFCYSHSYRSGAMSIMTRLLDKYGKGAEGKEEL